MLALLVGLVVGFLMVIPVGPVNVAVINTTLKKDYKLGLTVGLGGTVMDMVYFLIISQGLSFISFNPTFLQTIKVCGVFFLLIIGIYELRLWESKIGFASTGKEKKYGKKGYFLLGVFLYSSNPTLFAGLSTICATIKSYNVYPDVTMNHIFLTIGVGIGSGFWYWMLVMIVRKYTKKFTGKLLLRVNRICGGLILSIAFYMAFVVMQEFKLYDKFLSNIL
ncbi:MAG: LysE family transporter [Bacteriovoracaceae bacterium]|nr:LysE family transporter [Bacteriovoracaceae bacterium]